VTCANLWTQGRNGRPAEHLEDEMSALVSRLSHSPVAARVRRISAVLAAAGAGLFAWVAAVPAASAASIPIPVGENGPSPDPTVLMHPVIRVVQGGGMPGWQIAAIAVAAALAAAAAAVYLDRVWTHRHPARAA
jgi:hypothetical protein